MQIFRHIFISKFMIRREEEESGTTLLQKSSKKKSSGLSPRNRTLSTESNSSMASDSDDDARPKPTKVESIFDDFDLEEKPVVSRTAESVAEIKNGDQEADKFLTSFYGGKEHDQVSMLLKNVFISGTNSTNNRPLQVF